MNRKVKFLSKTKGKLNIIFWSFTISLIIITLASIGCLYALFLNLPIQILLVFFVGLIFFSKQVYDGVSGILLLSSFVTELIIHDDAVEFFIIPGRNLFYKNNNISSLNLVTKKSNLFKKIQLDSSSIYELVIKNKKYFISLSQDDYESLNSLVLEQQK